MIQLNKMTLLTWDVMVKKGVPEEIHFHKVLKMPRS